MHLCIPVSCSAALILQQCSFFSNLDFFHCSMKYTQIHTLFYAINYLKCKVVIFNTVEICDLSVYSHCLSPFLDSSVQSWMAGQCSRGSLPCSPLALVFE